MQNGKYRVAPIQVNVCADDTALCKAENFSVTSRLIFGPAREIGRKPYNKTSHIRFYVSARRERTGEPRKTASRRCIFQRVRNELYSRNRFLTPTVSAVLSIINVTFITLERLRSADDNIVVRIHELVQESQLHRGLSFIFRCAIRSR